MAPVNFFIRPAQAGDGEGLAQAALDLAEQYVQLDPERFKRPEVDLIAWNEAELQEPLPEDRVWLVAEVDGSPVGEASSDRGAELILTDTNLRSPEAVRFYEKQGYTRQSVVLRKQLT
jgi:hypothetical protein